MEQKEPEREPQPRDRHTTHPGRGLPGVRLPGGLSDGEMGIYFLGLQG